MLVVDFHIHPTTKGLLPWVYDWMIGFLPPGVDPQGFLDETVTKEGMVRVLDENGLDYAVALAELNPRVTGVITNEELAELCRGVDRLIPFGDVNPHLTASPAEELDRCVREWGFRGVKLYPVYQLFYANDRLLYPFYEKAQELAAVQPNEILLIDDTRPNLVAADKAGWHGLWSDEMDPEDTITRVRKALEF